MKYLLIPVFLLGVFIGALWMENFYLNKYFNPVTIHPAVRVDHGR